MVLAFFGFVATRRQRVRAVPAAARPRRGGARSRSGCPACGILLANNVRDVDTDIVSRASARSRCASASRAPRLLYVGCLVGALVAVVGCAFWHPWALIALAAAPLALAPVRLVRTRSDPPSLVAALIGTVRFQLVLAALLAVGLRLS